MSQNDEIKLEYKTIRLSAPVYYKLVELTGLLSAALGENLSLTQVADLLLTDLHQNIHPNLVKVIKDPKLIEQYRKYVAENVKPVIELFKNVKVRE